MSILLRQIKAVILINLVSIRSRGFTTIVTLFSVAVVVAVLLAFLAMSNGFDMTMKNSGSDAIGIAIRGGSQGEINSALSIEDIKLLEDSPGIARNENGQISSPELYVIVTGIKRSTKTETNLSLRGLSAQGVTLRPNVKISEGRMFEPGRGEVVVGRRIFNDYEGFELGDMIKLGRAEWKVVGIFTSNGSVHESEIWADVKTVQSQFNRGNSYQVLRFALDKNGDLDQISKHIGRNPQLSVDVFTEEEYFANQAEGLKLFINLGWFLSIMMALGALAGALNAMYTSVEQRSLEIATLRAIGFRGTAAFAGTLVESLFVSIIGGLIGAITAFLFFNGMTGSTLGATSFTQIVFDFQLSPESVKLGMTIAIAIGLIGGVFPALKAARIPVVKAFSL